MKTFNICLLLIACLLGSCDKEELTCRNGDILLEVETGEYWLHDYPLFLGVHKKNPPQFAIWIEDEKGQFITTVFATYKIATEAWIGNGGNRRKESLPHWCHQRNVVYNDGLLLPTKSEPLTDGITGATPLENKTVCIQALQLPYPFIVKAEFNHSVDFNQSFPKGAKVGEVNYSGGKEGSGQPAVVYAAAVYPDTRQTTLTLIGHSSPDGNDGSINTDVSSLTTAQSIVKCINLTIK